MRSMLAAAVLVLAAGLVCPEASRAEQFEFVAMGDIPYGDYAKFERLVERINKIGPAFSIHVGDIKSGGALCTDKNFARIRDIFATFEQPLVYTPGDNEWTDCHRPAGGKYDPLDRLAKIREMFFADPEQSLGKTPMRVESQARQMPSDFSKYVENLRFEKGGVLFVTIHVVGSNNGLEARGGKDQPQTASEYFDRDRANTAWLRDAFKQAGERSVKALVIAMQADPYEVRQAAPATGLPLASGFRNTIDAIKDGAKDFAGPILVIHGDTHRMELARFADVEMKPIPGVWRLEVMGEQDVHAIRVTVDTEDPGVFGFKPLIVPENGRY